MVGDEDAFDLGRLAARQHAHGVANRDAAALDLPLKAAERMIRTADALHGQVEALLDGGIRRHIDLLEIWQQCLVRVPRHVRGFLRNVVALGRGDGDDDDIFEVEFFFELANLRGDFREPLLVVADEVHLVDGKDEVPDAHECANSRMPPRLRQHALLCVDEDDGEVGERRAAGHVARVFLMARRVGADKAAIVRREIAIGHINRDALLALG